MTHTRRTAFVNRVNEGGVHRRNLLQALHDGEGDEVREGDLRAARTRERLIECDTVYLEESSRDGSNTGRRGYREARFHIGDDSSGRSSKRCGVGVDCGRTLYWRGRRDGRQRGDRRQRRALVVGEELTPTLSNRRRVG